MTDDGRYVLIEVPPGGLLLDRESGLTLELNAPAVLAWRMNLAGEAIHAIVTSFAAQFGVSPETALADVTRSLRDLPILDRAAPQGEFRYQRSNGDYVFSRNGQPLFVVDERGDQISSPAASGIAVANIGSLLYGLCPKLLSLRGRTVLHASAVAIDGRAIAFSGHSGAGKTTTAHALVRAGATLICEDKLVLHHDAAGDPNVFSTSEQALRRWVERAAVELAAGKTVSCAPLDAPPIGPAARLREIGFVSAERRGLLRHVEALPVSAVHAAGAVFSNTFHGSDSAEDWVRQLKASSHIARRIDAYQVSMPDGLEVLCAAVAPLVAARSLRSK